jgi:hypothetical protein
VKTTVACSAKCRDVSTVELKQSLIAFASDKFRPGSSMAHGVQGRAI